MKAVIPAAGYATRLYPLTENTPKAMLEIGGKPMIEHVIGRIAELDAVDEIFVVTNSKFYPNFREWLSGFECSLPIEVLDDGTASNEARLGAIGDKCFAIKEKGIKSELLDISSDNLFNFSLKEMHSFFREKNTATIAAYDVKTKEEAQRFGIVELDAEKKVTSFVEKPSSPNSTLASIGIYMYPKETVKLFSGYLEQGNNPDAPGYFLEWLHKKQSVYCFVFDNPADKWFDIGDKSTLEKARSQLK